VNVSCLAAQINFAPLESETLMLPQNWKTDSMGRAGASQGHDSHRWITLASKTPVLDTRRRILNPPFQMSAIDGIPVWDSTFNTLFRDLAGKCDNVVWLRAVPSAAQLVALPSPRDALIARKPTCIASHCMPFPGRGTKTKRGVAWYSPAACLVCC
jgi:hypothetical protein